MSPAEIKVGTIYYIKPRPDVLYVITDLRGSTPTHPDDSEVLISLCSSLEDSLLCVSMLALLKDLRVSVESPYL